MAVVTHARSGVIVCCWICLHEALLGVAVWRDAMECSYCCICRQQAYEVGVEVSESVLTLLQRASINGLSF